MAQAYGPYLIRSEAGGTGTLRSLQIGTGLRLGTNLSGLDTIIHAGQGTGTAAGGSIQFQVAPGGSGFTPNTLVTAWQIGNTGHLTAGDPAKMIKWAANAYSPAIKAISGSNPELQIRRGDDSAGAALLFRLSVAAKTMTYPIGESESNRSFTNEGASGAVTFNLPNTYATVGFHCWFVVAVAASLNIVPYGSDTIRIATALTTQGNGKITASVVGSTIHLICTQVNKWVALSQEGVWTVS